MAKIIKKGEWSEIAIAYTATPTLTAALAAGLSYGSLIITDFRGFRQFGIIDDRNDPLLGQ